MKKIASLLVVVLVLGVSAAAHAANTKIIFDQGPEATEEASGFVMFNWVNDGKVVIVFQVRGLDPSGQYVVYVENEIDIYIFGELKMNKNGSGHLYLLRDPDPDPLKSWIGIANTDIGVGNTYAVLLTLAPPHP